MNIWAGLLFMAMALGCVGFIVWVNARSHHRQVDAFLTQLTELHASNNALMEALARKNNAPLIFQKPETRKSEGWWDTRAPEAPQITVDRES